MCLDELTQQAGGQQRRVAGEHEDVAVVSFERAACGAHSVAGAERRLLDRDLDATRGVLVACGRRGDHDERPRARFAARLDDPVDHPAAENLVEVLRDGGFHPRSEAAGHDDGCEGGIGHGGRLEIELGRQDSNLGSRDQNPLPYRLATPHRGADSTRAL
jgi:hypothetical protein